MPFAIYYNVQLKREVVHETDDRIKTLCGHPIEEDWLLMDKLNKFNPALAFDCQVCQRVLAKRSAPPPEKPKKKTRMYMGHQLN